MYELIVLVLAGSVVWLARERRRSHREVEELKKTVDAAWRAIESLARDSGSGVRRPRTAAAAGAARAEVAESVAGVPGAPTGRPPIAAGMPEAAPPPLSMAAEEPGEDAVSAPDALSREVFDAAVGPERRATPVVRPDASGALESEPAPPLAAAAPGAFGAGAAPAPPPLPPVRPSRPTPPAKPATSASLEQLLGVRGAAIGAGIAIVMAALLGLKAAIEQGWLGPEARVVLGFAAGIGGLIGSGFLFRRGLTAGANALAGAGAAILYAVAWAAYRRYQLIGLPPAFVLMVLVTVVSGLLSVRRASLVIAVLGLVGGFATPLVLSTGEDHPIGLFSYVLLLDLGVLAVAFKQRWPQLGLLGALLTVAIQGAWVFARFTPASFFLALSIFALFGVFFALLGFRVPQAERGRWKLAQAIGAGAPFVFGIYVAQHEGLVAPLVPLAGFAVILSLAAQALARAHREPGLGFLGVAGVLGLLAVWLGTTPEPASLTKVVAVWVALAALHHGFLEWDVRRGRALEGGVPPIPVLVAGLTFLACALLRWDASNGPWAIPILGWALGGLSLRQARVLGKTWIGAVAGVAVTALFVGWFANALDAEPASFVVGVLIATAIAAQVAALVGRRGATWLAGEIVALLLPVGLTLFSAALVGFGPLRHEPVLILVTSLVFGALALLAVARAGYGSWAFAAMLAVALVHAAWQGVVDSTSEPRWLGLPFHAIAVAMFAGWPFVVARRFETSRGAWRAAALAPLVWLLPARDAWLGTWGDGAIGALPLLLAVPSVLAAARARGFFAADDDRRRWSLAWFAAVALGLVSVAIPMQLEREWITIGWALEGLALMVLFERLDQVGLKYVSVAFLATITVRLCGNAAVFSYHPRGHLPVLNWLLYTYAIPAAALVESARRLAPIEVARLRPRERSSLYPKERPWLAAVLGLAAVVVVFVWINLTIADAFGTGAHLTLDFSRTAQARNLTTSVAWALYAVVLLVIGVARGIEPLRWVSLAVLAVAVVKVFLWDLSGLTGLYRAASFLGLGVGLLLVSLLYQRFVYRKEPS